MRYHRSAYFLVHQGFEGCQFYFIQPFQTMFHHWQIQMRINIRIPMPWEMFYRRQHAVILQTLCISKRFRNYILNIRTKRTIAYNRIFGIGIHIHHRSKVPVNSHFLCIFCYFRRHFIDQIIILNRSKGHRPREFVRCFYSLIKSPFGIHTKEHRHSGSLLKFIYQHYFLLGIILH